MPTNHLENSTNVYALDPEPWVIGRAVEVVVLYADTRGFSNWVLTVTPDQVADFSYALYEYTVHLGVHTQRPFRKFLGDGFLLLWEVPDCGSAGNALSLALGTAFEIHKWYWHASAERAYPSPAGLGIAIAGGTSICVQPSLVGERDFVGYPLNCGARLQGLAGPYGVVLDAHSTALATVHHRRLLREHSPTLHLALHPPTPAATLRVRAMKGLREEDRGGFSYVTWPAIGAKLWERDGRL